ncbi:uncharacterized protein [Macrobrachium rosenbergii]
MVLLIWDNWCEHVCRQLPYFFIREALTDVTIIVGTKTIKAHRIILSFFSPFFKQVLDEVSEEQPIVVVFPEVNFKALQIVITYMYLGQVNVPAEILPLVTDLAKMLKVKGLIKLPVYWDSVICGTEVKVIEDEESFESAGEDQVDFTSEPEGIVELEVSTADGEHTVSSNMQMVNCRTAVTVITNTSPCASPRKGLQSPVNTKENQASESQSSVDSSIDIPKNGSGVNDDHILIEAEDIQMSVVDERNPNHIKLSEDRSMSEILFSGDYMDEERSLDDQTSSKEPHSISVLQKHSSRRRRDHLYKLAKYGPEDLERAIEDLKAGTGTLREIAGRWGVPKSTLSVSAKIAGISSLQKPPDYDNKAIEEAKQLVRAGTSYMKAAKEYNIPKSVLWRKCQKDNIFPKESQRFYSYSQDDVIRAKEMLCSGQSLIEIVKETKIPKTTVFRLKEQLVREGKMPASCITRIFRSKRPSEGSLQQAVVACKEGLSLGQASEKLQVAKTTVWRRLQRLKDQDSTATPPGEAKEYKVKENIKIEVPDQSDLDYDNYCCYGLTETLAKKNHISKRKSVDVTTLESDAINSTDSQTVVLESEESFLANEGPVIRTRSPLAIKEESLNEEDAATVVTSENSGNAHFQLEMPLVNFTGGGYQVVGSEIVIGGQHMVVLDSTGSSQHSHSNADGHIVVTPFTEMEVTNDESSRQSPSTATAKSHVYNPVQEALAVSASSPQGITVCLQSIKTESNAHGDQQKTVSVEQMSELITEFMSVD